ncbi:MAG: hypothetical protein R2838_04990 [Caldilineaceae bacterium]
MTELGAKKITIQDDSNRLQVRPKDVTVLHPGPLRSLNELCAVTGEVESAWELLAGQLVTLAELAELAYGEFTPVTAWAAWELVVDGLYFTGEPDAIQARTADARAAEVAARAAKAAEEAAWQAFVARVDAGTFAPDDVDYLRDVEELALGQRDQSRTMQALERSESPQEAHALLLRLGYWTPAVNPHPRRFDMPLTDPVLTLPALPDEARRDLTGLRAWLSTTWAARPGRRHQHRRHAAVGACGGCGRAGRADSPLDLEARPGGNLYRPRARSMLPPPDATATRVGLQDVSPALSIGIDVDEEACRLPGRLCRRGAGDASHGEAEANLDDPLLAQLAAMAAVNEARRLANGAWNSVCPRPKCASKTAKSSSRRCRRWPAAIWCARPCSWRAKPWPALRLSTRFPCSTPCRAARMWMTSANCRRLKPRPKCLPCAGCSNRGGSAPRSRPMPAWAWTPTCRPPARCGAIRLWRTSRYAYLLGAPLLDEEALNAPSGRASLSSAAFASASAHPTTTLDVGLAHAESDWQGRAVVVEKRGAGVAVIVEELALDAELLRRASHGTGSDAHAGRGGWDLPQLEARFRLA